MYAPSGKVEENAAILKYIYFIDTDRSFIFQSSAYELRSDGFLYRWLSGMLTCPMFHKLENAFLAFAYFFVYSNSILIRHNYHANFS